MVCVVRVVVHVRDVCAAGVTLKLLTAYIFLSSSHFGFSVTGSTQCTGLSSRRLSVNQC